MLANQPIIANSLLSVLTFFIVSTTTLVAAFIFILGQPGDVLLKYGNNKLDLTRYYGSINRIFEKISKNTSKLSPEKIKINTCLAVVLLEY